MTEEDWVTIDRIPGDLQAEIMKGFLEAQGIPVHLAQEGAARAIGLTAGPLAEVELMVPPSYVEQAVQILNDSQKGIYETEDDLQALLQDESKVQGEDSPE